jgi:hypothetical protein
MKLLLSLVLCLLAYVIPASAHNFKLDVYGCHNNGTLAVYECHSGKLAGKSWANPDGKAKMLVELNTPPPPPPLPCIPPPPPTANIGRASSGVLLTWDAVPPMEEPVTYEISFYARDSRDHELPMSEIDRRFVTVPVGVHTTVFLGSIVPDTNYWFRVRAIHKQAYSAWSSLVSFKGTP